MDASAVLAFLRDEPGADVVSEALVRGAAISAVNWAEVTGRFAEAGHAPEEMDRLLDDDGALGGGALLVMPFERSDSILVAKLRPLTLHLGLALGDRACLALGQRLRLPVLTAHRVWTQIGLGLEIISIRP